MKLTNYRLELAFLIPDDKKMSVDEVKLTVSEAIEAIDKDTLKGMKAGAVRFGSLEDLQEYSAQLNALKAKWNSDMKKRQKEQRNGQSSGNNDRTGEVEQSTAKELGQPENDLQEKASQKTQGREAEPKERS